MHHLNHSLSNHFLIAMPGMVDEDFAKTVVYLFDHGSHGAAGLVINRPSATKVKQLFDRVDMVLRRQDLHGMSVFDGGPNHTDHGFILHEALPTMELLPAGLKEIESAFYTSSIPIEGGLVLTTSRDVMEALSSGMGPRRVLVTLGFCQWAPKQLEDELADNSWLTVPADHRLIFETPAQDRYKAALDLLGIDALSLSAWGGSA